VLVPRKGYEKPLIRAARKAAATETAAPDISGK
jgi:hypothetical protein